jgi:integrase
MSIWTDEKGRWHVGIMVDGKRVHRNLGEGSTQGDAKRVEAELRVAVARAPKKAPVIPGDPPMTKAMALYIESCDRLSSPDTAKHHAYRIGPWIEGKKVSEARQVAAKIVSDLSKAYKPATINRSLGALKRALKLAWQHGLTHTDYSPEVTRVTENNQRDVVLSIEQIKKIADLCSLPVQAAIWISLYTGCRRAEALRLTPDDVSDTAITFRTSTTKTRKPRVVPVVEPLRPWLKHLPIGVNFEGVKSAFRRARVDAGMPHVQYRDLRRSCATLLLQNDVPLNIVSAILGHSSTKVTESRYAYLATSQLSKALNGTFKK